MSRTRKPRKPQPSAWELLQTIPGDKHYDLLEWLEHTQKRITARSLKEYRERIGLDKGDNS